MNKINIQPLQTSFYKTVLKSKFNIDFNNDDDIEEVVSKNPKKYYIDGLYNSNDLPKNKIHKFVLKSLYQNSFAPTKCIVWVETQANNIQVIKLDNKITIYIVGIDICNTENTKHIINIVKWISQYSTTTIKLNLFIFLTPFKKTIKYKGQQLTRNEINSGVCYRYNNWVQVFRSEEILKVLIHELLHYYELDINNTFWVDDILPIKLPCNPLLLNEAVAESMAIILHTYYYSEIICVGIQGHLEDIREGKLEMLLDSNLVR